MHGTRTAESGIVTLVSFPTSAFQLSTMSNYVNQWFLSWFCVYITGVEVYSRFSMEKIYALFSEICYYFFVLLLYSMREPDLPMEK